MKRFILNASIASLLLANSFAGDEDISDVYSEHQVTFKGILYRQSISKGALRVLKTRVSTKDILRILKLELGRDFGKKPRLIILEKYTSTVPEEHRTSIEDWNWCVRTKNDVIDVSEFFVYTPAPDSNTVVNEKRRNQTIYGLDKVFIGTELLFFDFIGLAQFTISESTFRLDKVTNRVFHQSTNLSRVSGEGQTTAPPRTYPMDGSFSVGKGKLKYRD